MPKTQMGKSRTWVVEGREAGGVREAEGEWGRGEEGKRGGREREEVEQGGGKEREREKRVEEGENL